MKVSVITTVYNRPEHFRLMLAALAAQSRRPDEVVVADDGSDADTVTAMRAHAESSPLECVFVRQEKDGYRLAAARNLAIRAATGDYLVFADNLKTYIINRRGEVRINVTNSFPKARNSLFYLESGEGMATRFVTSNSSGEIIYIYTDGSCKSKTFKNLSADHYFVLKDIDGDGVMEYIFTDQDMLYVYRENGSEKFSHCFDNTVGRPNIFKFSANDVRIGVTCRGQKQLFLFDNKGNICNGFPLQGTSEFSITKLDRNAKFSLLAGNADNYLYNYIIQ